MTVEVKLDSTFIKVTFPYSRSYTQWMKTIPGARFNNRNEDDPHWRVPLDLESCHELRDRFGPALTLHPSIKDWARSKTGVFQELQQLSSSDSAELINLPHLLPELFEAIHLGPKGRDMTLSERKKALKMPSSYQAADVKFMAISSSPGNCNQPGLGKTVETIGAVYEGLTHEGAKLVVAPLTSLETVWKDQLEMWQDQRVIVAPPDKQGRIDCIALAQSLAKDDRDFWLVVNPGMVQYRNDFERCSFHSDGRRKRPKVDDMKKCDSCINVLSSTFPELMDINWRVVVLDEFHKMGLNNTATLTHKAVMDLKSDKRIALSGTPMGGKPFKIFGPLQFLHPEEFTSKWRFADRWMVVADNKWGGKDVGEVSKDKEDEFNDMLSRYIVRRTKTECTPWLPEKQWVDINVPLRGGQKEQYEIFAKEAEIRINDEYMTATSILAEYTRLKQFASAAQVITGRDGEGRPILTPTTESNKLPVLLDLLEERGICGDSVDNDGEEQVVVFSQFSALIDMIHEELLRLGFSAGKITGAVKSGNRKGIIDEFQSGEGIRVLCMTTTAGGVSITLDRASTVVFMDETWNPDDQEQAEDRCHRVSRVHNVTVYTLRSTNSIEEYIHKAVKNKRRVNEEILDLHRAGFRATRGLD